MTALSEEVRTEIASVHRSTVHGYQYIASWRSGRKSEQRLQRGLYLLKRGLR